MNTSKIKEFPLSGMFSKPLSILDSWKFIIKNNNYDKNDFIKEIESYLKYFNDFNPPFCLIYMLIHLIFIILMIFFNN